MSKFFDNLTRSDQFNIYSILKPLGLILFLYLFVLSITLLGDSFKLFGKDFAHSLIASTSNPMVGLFIGILATSIIQSSSTTTSIVVGLVGAGFLSFEGAIPIVMGANIGTTITNALVSLTHISRKREFLRAFSGAIVHDVFNVLTVLIVFPLQYFTNFLGHSASFTAGLFADMGGLKFSSPIKIITKPISVGIIDLLNQNGWLTALVAIVLLFIALKMIVTVIKSLVLVRVEQFFGRYVFKTTFRALLLGIVLTAIVQSSSITTSLVIPLLGAGILRLRQVFPYTVGANTGTTVTAILASLVTSDIGAVSVAFAHLFFNICGMAIFIPLSRIPINLARRIAVITLKSKLIPFAFILLLFFVIPLVFIYLLR